MKKIQKALSILLAVCMVAALAVTAFAASYTDTDGHWAEDAIERWTDLEIVNGYTDGEYKPENELTRGQAALIFARLLKLEKKADISNFTDVAADAYYADAIAQVVERGIMRGTSETTMNPEDTLKREDFFTMLVRALGIPFEEESDKTFTDESKVSSYAAGAINALVNAGYVKGYEDGSLRPENEIKRSEIVALFHQTVVVYANEDGAEVVAPENGVVIVVADDVTVKSENDETVTVVVAKEDSTVTVETEGVVSVVVDGATVNVAEENTVYVNADDTTIAATEKAEVVVNAKDAAVSLEGTTADVKVTVSENNVEITDAPAGTSVSVDKDVTGTTVNNNKVDSDTTEVIKEEPAPYIPYTPTPVVDDPVDWKFVLTDPNENTHEGTGLKQVKPSELTFRTATVTATFDEGDPVIYNIKRVNTTDTHQVVAESSAVFDKSTNWSGWDNYLTRTKGGSTSTTLTVEDIKIYIAGEEKVADDILTEDYTDAQFGAAEIRIYFNEGDTIAYEGSTITADKKQVITIKFGTKLNNNSFKIISNIANKLRKSEDINAKLVEFFNAMNNASITIDVREIVAG